VTEFKSIEKEISRMNRIFAAVLIVALFAGVGFAKDGHTERNKAIVRQVFTDIFTRGKYEVADQIYAKDFVSHDATRNIGFDENLANVRGWRSAFPDLEMIVDQEIAEGDFVTVLWRGRGTNTGNGNGLNSTGRRAQGRGISIFRVEDGKIKEEWTEYSQLLLMQQLGLMGGQK
jgi:predicted ester cyclase